jgi:hypothetical protein
MADSMMFVSGGLRRGTQSMGGLRDVLSFYDNSPVPTLSPISRNIIAEIQPVTADILSKRL